jgi:hypothetical protein
VIPRLLNNEAVAPLREVDSHKLPESFVVLERIDGVFPFSSLRAEATTDRNASKADYESGISMLGDQSDQQASVLDSNNVADSSSCESGLKGNFSIDNYFVNQC